MADDLDVAFQKSLFTALSGDATLTTLLGGGMVHDSVPKEPVFPYVRIGEDDAVDRSTSCHVIDEITSTVHVFSREPGRVQAKAVARQVRRVMDAGFAVAGFTLKVRGRATLRVFTDPDGLTAHAVVTRPFQISPA